MKLNEFSQSYNSEYLKFFGTVYNNLVEQKVILDIDDEVGKVVGYECSCKYGTISIEQNGKMKTPCKHIKFFVAILNDCGHNISLI